MTTEDLIARLERLEQSIPEATLGTTATWPVARVFNALLLAVRDRCQDDPVISTIGSLRQDQRNDHLTVVDNATVQILAGQLVLGLRRLASSPGPAERPPAAASTSAAPEGNRVGTPSRRR